MALAGYKSAGFDYLRIFLASSVVLFHSLIMAEGPGPDLAAWTGSARPIIAMILPMFFALSGFLVAGSFERCKSLVSFLGLRAIRLLPALATETILSAVVLGAAFTSLTWTDYFSNPGFFRYFLNILGDVHFTLPGVFVDNPARGNVNGQLWTLPWELRCYLVLAAIGVVGVVSRARLLVVTLLLIQAAVAAYMLLHYPHIIRVHGVVLVACFLAGLVLYRLRRELPYNGQLALLCAAACAVLFSVPGGDPFTPLPAAYVTVYLGLLNPPRHRLLLSGDYSYGIYLYGAPIQAGFTALGPWTHHWWLNFLAAYPAAVLFAVFSWWCIEKPAMRLRGVVMRVEGWMLTIKFLRWHSHRIFSAPAKN